MSLTLHGYWRSSASYRVRIALALKSVPFEQVSVDLREGQQRTPEYLTVAPHGLVPALVDHDTTLIESPAILEWIEERWPKPALLPANALDRAIVRSMAALIACDIDPLANLRVLNELRSEFSADEEQVRAWIARWITDGFAALEQLVVQHGRRYCFGDSITFADCYLVRQMYNAERFNVDLSAFPRIVSTSAEARALPAFIAADPTNQPDADPAA